MPNKENHSKISFNYNKNRSFEILNGFQCKVPESDAGSPQVASPLAFCIAVEPVHVNVGTAPERGHKDHSLKREAHVPDVVTFAADVEVGGLASLGEPDIGIVHGSICSLNSQNIITVQAA
jgi:hypothetical protein